MEEKTDVLVCIVQAAYNIGGHVISANAIENSIFGFHTPRMGRVSTSLSSSKMAHTNVKRCRIFGL